MAIIIEARPGVDSTFDRQTRQRINLFAGSMIETLDAFLRRNQRVVRYYKVPGTQTVDAVGTHGRWEMNISNDVQSSAYRLERRNGHGIQMAELIQVNGNGPTLVVPSLLYRGRDTYRNGFILQEPPELQALSDNRHLRRDAENVHALVTLFVTESTIKRRD